MKGVGSLRERQSSSLIRELQYIGTGNHIWSPKTWELENLNVWNVCAVRRRESEEIETGSAFAPVDSRQDTL